MLNSILRTSEAVTSTQKVADRRRDGHARSTSLASRGSVSVVPLVSPTQCRSPSIGTAVCLSVSDHGRSTQPSLNRARSIADAVSQ